MKNGYAMCSAEGLAEIDRQPDAMDGHGLDALRGQLRIGLQWQADVTDLDTDGHQVLQAFCSALPVAYKAQSGAKTFDAAALRRMAAGMLQG